MKRILLPLILLTLAACATAPLKPAAPPQPAFHADMYEVIALEYSGPTTIVGVSPYGPTDKAEACARAAAATVVQGDQLPGHHQYAATCLHIALSAPAITGQVVMQPFSGRAAAYIAIAVGLDATGNLLGVKPLRGLADAETCHAFAEQVRQGVVNDHVLPPGSSFIVYCMGTPVLPSGPSSDSSVVYTRPCPNYPFPGAGACQIAIKEYVRL